MADCAHLCAVLRLCVCARSDLEAGAKQGSDSVAGQTAVFVSRVKHAEQAVDKAVAAVEAWRRVRRLRTKAKLKSRQTSTGVGRVAARLARLQERYNSQGVLSIRCGDWFTCAAQPQVRCWQGPRPGMRGGARHIGRHHGCLHDADQCRSCCRACRCDRGRAQDQRCESQQG